MNSIGICGRLGSPAEVRSTQAGTKVTSFEVAQDLGWGERKKTIWVKCAWWGERGEKVAPYLVKGTQVFVLGRLADVEAFNKRDGSAGSALKIDVIDLELLGGKKDSDQSEQDGKGWDAPASGGGAGWHLDDDVPFGPCWEA